MTELLAAIILMAMPPTDTARTAKHKLLDRIMVNQSGTDLGGYVARQRADGQSWRKIAAAVHRITGEDVADVTLIAWFPEAVAE